MIKPIRVCFMIDELTNAGTETQLVALIQHIDRRRIEPYLCLLRGEDPRSRALEPASCPILRLDLRSLRHPSTPAKLWRLVRFLRRRQIDVFQVYFPESTYLGIPAARLAGVPHIVRTRNNQGYWMTSFHRWMGRFYQRFTDATVANCEACRQAAIAEEGAPPESVLVLENGVDLDRFPLGQTDVGCVQRTQGALHAPYFGRLSEAQAPNGTMPHARRVGVVANLRPVKDLEVLVRAAGEVASLVPNVSFDIAGEGELRPVLERLASELGLQGRFHLPGTVSDIPAFLHSLDVAVLCSRSEGMSNALLEYMAAGKAIVATAVGGNVQLIEDGVHGLLVSPGNVAELAAAIRRLLHDSSLAARLGSAARRRIEQHYSRAAMERRFEEFYFDLMFSRSSETSAGKSEIRRCRFETVSNDLGAGRGSPDPVPTPDRRSPAHFGRPSVISCAGLGDPRTAIGNAEKERQ
jgi:glycosyltransferase involved in cell wall biosynthesis